tara:strand:+ start:5029 stop:5631 length:603 start_codon:yes stop_codon:yes gene_type:complete
MSRSKNGTAYNDTSDQTIKQREAYSETFGGMLGQKSTLYGFNHPDKPKDRDVMEAAKSILDTFYSPVGHNPDFSDGIEDSRLSTFSIGKNKFDDIKNAKDLPNRLGPNIKALDVNSPPLSDVSDTPEGHVQVSSLTNTGEQVDVAGFGVHIDRNDPNHNPSVKTFLNRRGTTPSLNGIYVRGDNIKLGEYIDSETYEYKE